MSQPTSSLTPLPGNRAMRNRSLVIVTVCFTVIGMALLIWWLCWGQYEEQTDDAYVHGNLITIQSQVRGAVSAIYVDETERVEEGQLILQLDPTDYDVALGKAEAELGESVREVARRFEHVRVASSYLDEAEAELIRSWVDYRDRQPLVGTGAISQEEWEHVEAALMASYARLAVSLHQLAEAEILVENTTLETHPLVEKAREQYKEAWVQRQRCDLRAPASGIVTMRSIQVGEWVNPQSALMAIVPISTLWVDANFKEVQLQHVRVGQPVLLHADMYGRSVVYHGKVVGINPGTGEVFSVLPPQNATGNWIKIVQRVPVRVSLDPQELSRYPLWLGLSMKVHVSTRDRLGERVAARPVPSQRPLYATDVLAEQLIGAEDRIAQIIEANRPSAETTGL